MTGDELRKLRDYVKSLPINIDIEVNGQKYKLVHASEANDYADSGLQGYYDNEVEYAVWKRWRPNEPTPTGHIRICGHTPTIQYQDENPLKIWYGNNIIGIDCGAGLPEKQPYEPIYYKGSLSCLRLDDMKEFYSEEEY